MAEQPPLDDLKMVPRIPLDEEGAVFNSPWEAKIFAMVVSLHQQGHFEWTEWAETIGDEIEKDKQNVPETPYYELWLKAAERIIDAKGLCRLDEMSSVKQTLLAEQVQPHSHSH